MSAKKSYLSNEKGAHNQIEERKDRIPYTPIEVEILVEKGVSEKRKRCRTGSVIGTDAVFYREIVGRYASMGPIVSFIIREHGRRLFPQTL